MTFDDEAVFAAAAENRLRIADLLDGLAESEWAAPSLCDGWTVRHVAAHLLQHVFVGFGRFVLISLRHRGDTNAAVDHIARGLAREEPAEIVDLLRAHANDRVDPPRVGPWGPFADTCVHLRDIARPLGRVDDAPTQHWAALLGYLVSPRAAAALVPAGRAEGLAFVATDAGQRYGDGAVVRGRAEALGMALTGRTVAVADLSGPGVGMLRDRITRDSHAPRRSSR